MSRNISKSGHYREYPSGIGQIRSGKKGDNMVNLDLLIESGSRQQRRFALRELTKLKKAAD